MNSLRLSILSCLLFVGMSLSSFAQVQKQTLAVYAFSYDPSIDPAVAERACQYAYQGILESDRVELIDKSHEAIQEAFQQTEEASPTSGIDNPNLVLTGTLMRLDMKENVKTDEETLETKSTYEATLSFTVKVVDLRTGQVIASDQFSTGDDLLKSGNFGSLLSSAKTSEKAVDNALKGVKNKVKKFILKQFKLEAYVVEVLDNSAGLPKSILVAGGSAAGFKKNKKLYLQIRTPKTLPNGRTLMRTEEIGLIKIDKVEDEHFSVCTVLKGGDALAQALKEKKAVICLTKK